MTMVKRLVPLLLLAPALAALLPPDAAAAKRRRPSAVQQESAPDVVQAGRREDVMRYGAELAARRGLDAAWVADALSAARYQPSVARFIMPPPVGTAKNWHAYRSRFVEP